MREELKTAEGERLRKERALATLQDSIQQQLAEAQQKNGGDLVTNAAELGRLQKDLSVIMQSSAREEQDAPDSINST